MTKEEKAAAYDAAIKKVKELAIDDYLDAIAVTDIFPELKEIEDEKIINRIKKAVKGYWSDEPLDEILAWLEKQGETSPILSNSSNIGKNWSEDDDNCLSTIIAEFSKCSGKSVSKDEWMRCNDFLNSLRDRVQPKPQQEWDGDSAKMINECIAAIYAADCYSLEDKNQMEDWLKSLRPQNKWRPSESDIRILEQVIDGTVNPINYHATLYAILEQLKKLRE